MVSGDVPRQPVYRGLRTGGRSERVRSSIMAAALGELIEVGFADLSLARVATKADVALTTIHRRWSSKGALAADVIIDALASEISEPDEGSLSGDVELITMSAVTALRRPDVSALMKTTMLLAPPEFDRVRSRIDEIGTAVAQGLVERAVARGDLPGGTDPASVLELVLAGLWMRAVVSGGRLDARDLESFAADALAALQREVVA